MYGSLVAASACAFLLGKLTLHLRTASDMMVASPVLDRLILIGLALPIAVIVRSFEDRCAWMLSTGSRPRWVVRANYLAVVYIGSCALAAVLAWATDGQQSRLLVFSDFLLLLSIGGISALLLGAQMAWIAPAILALVCSTPGLIPLAINAPARADQAFNILWVASLLLTLVLVLFARFDDFGFGRKRLMSRLSGVTDE